MQKKKKNKTAKKHFEITKNTSDHCFAEKKKINKRAFAFKKAL